MQQLPREQLDHIWMKLSVAYGRAFAWQWDGIPLGAVLEDWAQELAGFADKPWAIEYALQHRPPKLPLIAAQFRGLCAQAPAPSAPAEAAPAPADVRRAAAVLGQLAPTQYRPDRGWAHRLMQQEAEGRRLGRAQRESWRVGLGFAKDAPLSAVSAQLNAR